MSKSGGKKEKPVSLVSAYESGAETDESSQTGSDHESNSNKNSVSDDDDDNNSQKSSTNKMANSAESRTQTTNGGEDSMEADVIVYSDGNVIEDIDEEMRVVTGMTRDESAMRSRVEEVMEEAQASNSNPGSVENAAASAEASLYSKNWVDFRFYEIFIWFKMIYFILKKAIENGFPPGCERIRLPPAPRTLCSQNLQVKKCLNSVIQ